ncbi:MAG: hypothetical protein K0U29_02560 [Gammaproteobacteria bacterium]|nr:hypothetical protein [Gammaproteobacteria bacterium]MCH9743791.1 hypothetical protein [Gammaproteobacteria bacterium]
MLNKRQTSRLLLKQGWHILKSNRQAILSPLLSNIIILILLAIILHPFIDHRIAKHFFEQAPILKILLFYACVLGFLFVTHIFAFFFMATLAAHILDYFDHKTTSFISTIKTVCNRFFSLYGWFLYASFAGFIFVIFQKPLRRNKWFNHLTQGLRWSLAIYLVIPLLLKTKIKTTDAIRRSSQLMADTWGKPLQYNHSFTGYSVQLKLLAFIPLIIGFIQGGHKVIITGSAISIVAILIISSCFMSIRMIVCCASYLHAEKHDLSKFINTEALDSAFIETT